MYSGLQYNAVVYEGFLPASPSATGDFPTPSSNVVDFDETRGRLGCGIPSFFITGRCSTGVACVLDNYVISANWDRRLDDVSEAEVIVEFGGDTEFTCCACLAEAEPWCHELHIWRDGEEVWVGPIEIIEYRYDTITIKARDSLWWMSVRVPPIDIDFTSVATELTTIAETVVNLAFAEDGPEFTCEVDNLYITPTGIMSFRFFEKFNQTALEILRDLGDTGVDFTTVGRTIVLFGDPTPLTPLVLLNDEHIVGGLTISKDGSVQGNRYFVHFEGDNGIPASSTATDEFCYGPIERIRDGDGLVDGISAGQVADIYVEASAIAPRTITLEEGAKLSPDTPWTINQMVCGARVDVAITKFCLNLTQSFRLTHVGVEYDADGGESIGVTLVPINSITTE